MDLFDIMKNTECKEVLFFSEPTVSLKAIVAINNTTLGPAVCSCKIQNYGNFQEAIGDALSLASYHTYSAALLRRNIGGGSVILWGDPKVVKSEMYFRALGICLNKLEGKVFLTGESGISVADLLNVKRESRYVLGLPCLYGGMGSTPLSTAKGVLWGIKAAVKHTMDETSLKKFKVTVQGIGQVGRKLVELLIAEGAEVTVADLLYDKIKEIQDQYPFIKIVRPQEIFDVDCDILAPCAPSFDITQENIPKMKCKIIAGAANLGLGQKNFAQDLAQKKILFVPGFLLNSGATIHISNELSHYGMEKTEEELKDIYHTVLSVLEIAKEKKQPVMDVALGIAHDYIQSVSAIKMLQ